MTIKPVEINRLGNTLKWAREQELKRKRGRGFVYVLLCGQFVKVGVAVNIKQRMASLQTGNPHSITCLCRFVSSCPYDAERAIHNAIATYAQRGEWFQLPKQLIARLKPCQTAPEAVHVVRCYMAEQHPQ